MPFRTCLDIPANALYPGIEGIVRGRMLPSPEAGVVLCRLEFNDGALAAGSLLAVEENGWLLLVHEYVNAQGRSIPARAWAVEQPLTGDPSKQGWVFRVRSMLPAGPVAAS